MSDRSIHCPVCGTVIGIWPDDLEQAGRRHNLIPIARCSLGRHHLPPREVSLSLHFGLLEKFRREYPDTGTHLIAARYIGPPSLVLLAFAFIFLVRRDPNERFKKLLLGEKWRVWLPFSRRFWEINRYLLRQQYTIPNPPSK